MTAPQTQPTGPDPTTLADARDEVRATRAERDRLIDVLARLMSLPPATVADAYAVRYTGRNGVKP